MDAQTETSRQIAAYALWLEERGLHTPAISDRRPESSTIPPVSTSEGTQVELLFVSDCPLTSDEHALLGRIITALAIAPERASTLECAEPEALRDALGRHRPAAVILLGVPALRAAVEAKASLRQLSGRIFRYRERYGDSALLVTYHPRDLLRFPANKRQAWDDLQRAAAFVRSQICAH